MPAIDPRLEVLEFPIKKKVKTLMCEIRRSINAIKMC